MAEMFIRKRVEFPAGQQKTFLEICQKNLKLSLHQMAKSLKIHVRTLSDWKREKFLMPLRTANFLSKKASVPLSNNILIRDKLNDLSRAARMGGFATYRKHGIVGANPDRRKILWKKWWNEKGKYLNNPILKRKLVNIPRKSIMLAEFVGIMMGDGGITNRQVCITLNYRDDYAYSLFVKNLVEDLFKLKPGIKIRKKENTINIVISRTHLVDFCREIGLKVGNKLKQGLDIPLWIKNDKSFLTALIRGLMDTDGCLVIHRYKVKSKQYFYKKISFSSYSPLLINSMLDALTKLNLGPRLAKGWKNVWIDDQKKVIQYMSLIGTHNPKHKERFLRRGG